MSKFNKVTYCKNCGGSNPWVMEAKSSLLQKPKFCTSCGTNLSTGQKPAASIKEVAAAVEVEEEEVSISRDIPPLELDLQECYFPKRDSQALGNLLKPVPKQDAQEEGL
tara:strand:- start:43 stop:369 length:327 start_codon:yes stop_codon:yes gene_type:complete